MRAVLSLPTPLLRLLSGGGVVYRAGRTLEPRIQAIAHAVARAPQPPGLSLDQARTGLAQLHALLGGAAASGVKTEALSIDGPRGPIGLRAYRGAGQDPASPLLVFAHGGGGCMGDLALADPLCGLLAREARCAVLSVDYRLAPEHRFPAGLEDVAAAFAWARANAGRFGAPAGRVAIGGESIGAGLAAAVAQGLRAAGEPQPALQLLICPALDLAAEGGSLDAFADAFPLSRASLAWCVGHYLAPDADPADPRVSPSRCADLTGLAPALVITAGFDPLADQGEAYARRLKAAGVETTLRMHETLPHGFSLFAGAVPAAEAACHDIAARLRAAFEDGAGG